MCIRDSVKLVDRIEKVRKLNLGRLEFRSCSLGLSAFTLGRLQKLFRCASVCAPKLLDAYGSVVPTFSTRAASWQRWRTTYSKLKVEGATPHRVGFSVKIVGSKVKAACIAESLPGLKSWLKRRFSISRYRRGAFFYHFMTNGAVAVYPTDADYRKNLNIVKKGALPSKKISLDPTAVVP